MPQVPVELKNGIATSVDECRAPGGFVKAAKGVWYRPEDPDRLWTLPGEILVGTIPHSSPLRGLEFLQYDNASNKLVAAAYGVLYEATADDTIASWATVATDLTIPPCPFGWEGSRLKMVHTGDNRWAAIGNKVSYPNLLRNSDGLWRTLGITPPKTPTLSAINSGPAAPITLNTHGVYGVVPPYLEWTGHINMIDGEDETLGKNTLTIYSSSTTEWAGNRFGFSGHGATVTANQSVQVKLRIYSPSTGVGETSVTSIQFDIYYSIGGTSYGPITVEYRTANQLDTITIPVPDGALLDSISIYALSRNYAAGAPPGTCPTRILVVHEVYEISLITAASFSPVTAGTYQYALTEVYKETLASGEVFTAESDPCSPVEITLNGTTHTGVTITLPTYNNIADDGFNNATLYWRIYRSTVGGTWPDLGFIDEVPVTVSSTYTDAFVVAPATLGTPTAPYIEVGGLVMYSNTPPPTLRDACLYRGALVGIDESSPREFVYSGSGTPEYFPSIQRFSLLPSDKNDELRGIETLADAVLVFSRSRVFRIRDLPFAVGTGFDLPALTVDILSGAEGLVSPHLYCKAQSWRGDALIFWVSDTGIWCTDGFLPAERGIGCQKATQWLDWEGMVDTTRLAECRLTYDPKAQIIWFDYYDTTGASQSLILHLSAHHWMGAANDQASVRGVPKITGPHDNYSSFRAYGTNVAETPVAWTIRSSGTVYRYAATGPWTINNPPISIVTHLLQPGNSLDGAEVHEGLLYHSDWGPNQSATIRVEARRDYSGIATLAHKPGISLTGARATRFWVNRVGNSFQLLIWHQGAAIGALGPVLLDMSPIGTLER